MFHSSFLRSCALYRVNPHPSKPRNGKRQSARQLFTYEFTVLLLRSEQETYPYYAVNVIDATPAGEVKCRGKGNGVVVDGRCIGHIWPNLTGRNGDGQSGAV